MSAVQSLRPPSPGANGEFQIAAELAAWLRAAGLTDRKLKGAIEVIESNDIEGISDLQLIYEHGSLDTVGFARPTLIMIEKALGAPADSSPAHGQILDGAFGAAAAARAADNAEAERVAQKAADASLRAAAEARAAGELAAAEAERAEQKAVVNRQVLQNAAKAGDEAEVQRVLAEGGCDVNWVRLHFRRVPCFCTVSSSSSQV